MNYLIMGWLVLVTYASKRVRIPSTPPEYEDNMGKKFVIEFTCSSSKDQKQLLHFLNEVQYCSGEVTDEDEFKDMGVEGAIKRIFNMGGFDDNITVKRV